METHRRVVVERRGPPDVLRLVSEPVPHPAAGEVRVKNEVAGVSAYDVMLRSKRFPGFPKLPFTPGVDIVGRVDAIGPGLTGFEIGDRVAASLGTGSGGYAEHVCVSAGELVQVPEEVDAAAVVCLVANYLTAHLAMHETAHVESGERILVHGAAGGVGSALLQLGDLAGLEMYGTASEHNHEFVRSLGATPIDYRHEDFVARIRELTGDGVDVVFDPIGGWSQLWRSHKALRSAGRLIWFGVAASAREGIKVIPLSLAMRTLLALVPGQREAPLMSDAGTYASEHRGWYRATLTEFFDYLAAGKLEPAVAARVPFGQVAAAHELLERGGHAGKVVLTFED